MRHDLDQMPEALMEVLSLDGRQAEEVAPLSDKDGHRDPGGKSHDHGGRNETYDGPHSGRSHEDQNDTGHESCRLQTRYAVFRGNSCEDRNEGTRRSSDLHPASAEGRHARSADDRSV